MKMRTIILHAPLFSGTGYGHYARDVFKALLLNTPYKVCGVPAQWGLSTEIPLNRGDIDDALKLACRTRPVQGEAGMIFIQLGYAQDFTPYERCLNIGVTMGREAESVTPADVEGARRMDVLIVSSTFTRDQFVKAGYTGTIYVVGQGVDLLTFTPRVGHTFPVLDSITTKFNFLTGGQWWGASPFESDRKGVAETIAAFLDTFPDSKEVGLIVKAYSFNQSSSDKYLTADKIRLMKGDKEFPKVHLIHGRMSDSEMAQVYRDARVNVFVSPTHGEGWGRMIAEAAACNLPIIVNGFGGHMDFVDPKKATVLPFEMQAAPRTTEQHLGAGARWAVASGADTKRFMLRAYHKYGGAVVRATLLGEAMRNRFSENVTRQELSQLIIHIAEA